MINSKSLGFALTVASVTTMGPGCGGDDDPAGEASITDTDGGEPMDGGGGGSAAADCGATPSLEMSPVIGTVGIVTFDEPELSGLDEPAIEFGLDTRYGMTAPVDLTEPGYRTLLLGMKAAREYHYRLVATTADGQPCTGPDQTLETGPRPNQLGLSPPMIDTVQRDKRAGGFIVSVLWLEGVAFILDADGDYVWWFQSPVSRDGQSNYENGADLARARLSWDGKAMWMRNANANAMDDGVSRVHRVSMDGMTVESFDATTDFGDGHHDFAVLPDESLLLIVREGAEDCDHIVERSPDGTIREVLDTGDAHGSTDCHVNSIHYHPDDDTFTFSDLNQNCYVKATRNGEILWVLGGGPASDFTRGDGVQWDRQHGHHLLGPDRMLMFENGSGPDAQAMVYELLLDEAAGSAERVWQYDGGAGTMVMGDVQRLPNGNTLVTYSVSGLIHEVDPDAELVQSIAFGLSGALGYSQWRGSLYGPPPR